MARRAHGYPWREDSQIRVLANGMGRDPGFGHIRNVLKATNEWASVVCRAWYFVIEGGELQDPLHSHPFSTLPLSGFPWREDSPRQPFVL